MKIHYIIKHTFIEEHNYTNINEGLLEFCCSTMKSNYGDSIELSDTRPEMRFYSENLSDILYFCPFCGAEIEMIFDKEIQVRRVETMRMQKSYEYIEEPYIPVLDTKEANNGKP